MSWISLQDIPVTESVSLPPFIPGDHYIVLFPVFFMVAFLPPSASPLWKACLVQWSSIMWGHIPVAKSHPSVKSCSFLQRLRSHGKTISSFPCWLWNTFIPEQHQRLEIQLYTEGQGLCGRVIHRHQLIFTLKGIELAAQFHTTLLCLICKNVSLVTFAVGWIYSLSLAVYSAGQCTWSMYY